METIQEAGLTPAVEQVQAKADTPQVKEPDLVTRVSQFKPEAPKAKEEPVDTEEKFDFKELEAEAEKNPILMKAYKSLQRGFNLKFQEIADLKKALDIKQPDKNWTPERIQELMNDPAFVQAAQQLAGPTQSPAPTEDEYSALSDKDKQKITQLEQELQAIRSQTLQAQFEAQKVKQDQELSQRYANYKPEAVDTIYADLLANKVQATREHLWKVIDYEPGQQRAYELGKQDALKELQEKNNSTSFSGGVQAVNGERPKALEGESSRNFFARIAMENLLKQRQK